MLKTILASLLLFCSISIVDAKTPPSQRKAPAVTYLTVLHAKDGKVTKQNGDYKLELFNVGKSVTLFSDRPNRKAFKISIDMFLENWNMGKESFEKVPPNASLAVLIKDNDRFKDVVLELSEPTYKAEENMLSFTIRPIEKDQKIDKADLGEVSLFIDGIPCPPNVCQIPN